MPKTVKKKNHKRGSRVLKRYGTRGLHLPSIKSSYSMKTNNLGTNKDNNLSKISTASKQQRQQNLQTFKRKKNNRDSTPSPSSPISKQSQLPQYAKLNNIIDYTNPLLKDRSKQVNQIEQEMVQIEDCVNNGAQYPYDNIAIYIPPFIRPICYNRFQLIQLWEKINGKGKSYSSNYLSTIDMVKHQMINSSIRKNSSLFPLPNTPFAIDSWTIQYIMSSNLQRKFFLKKTRNENVLSL